MCEKGLDYLLGWPSLYKRNKPRAVAENPRYQNHLILKLLQLSVAMSSLFSKPLKLSRKPGHLLLGKLLRRIGGLLKKIGSNIFIFWEHDVRVDGGCLLFGGDAQIWRAVLFLSPLLSPRTVLKAYLTSPLAILDF